MKKLLEILKFDRYDIEANLVPSVISLLLMIMASWQLFDYIGLVATNLKSGTATFLVLFVVIVTCHIVRIVGKSVIEPLLFGVHLQKLPTTRYLMQCDDFGDKLVANKVRQKVETEFDVCFKSKSQEKKNPDSAMEIIESAVRQIKKSVQNRSDDMYLRKNIRYGLFRNMTGGLALTILVEIALAVYSLIARQPFTIGWVSFAFSSVLCIVFFFSSKQAAKEYAEELFESYLSIRNEKY